ncbi:MAG: McrC family protein [Methanobrevibacter sp.]|jgi:5-methylcytosine-specific restriction endonuclease McrBC regulatory subunit McrC|nr:McrC family protein [Candidatus Methanovirga aequatorialis]
MKPLKDNSQVGDEYVNHSIILELMDRDLKDLERDNFVIFPPTVGESEDLDSENYIFKLHNKNVRTCNIVGILKKGNEEIKITSRFYNSTGGVDYFLRYLLQRVMNYNVVQSRVNIDSEDSYYDLMAYLFPMYLNNAMQKGIYKKYVKRQYNNANVKGPIDVSRHIKSNVPFIGNIAYRTREFSHDNRVTQLIRHALEKLQLDYSFDFKADESSKENVRAIKRVTSSYSPLNRMDVLQENILNPIRHGYFEEYYFLQKLCIQILREEKIGFGNEDDKVHGIIIDVAWLWEEYLNTILNGCFIHSENKRGKNGISIFDNRTRTVYPDFYSKDEEVVLDAKYKKMSEKSIDREDLYQIISYLHVLESKKAGIIYPDTESTKYDYMGTLKGFGGKIFKQSLKIPQEVETYPEFESSMTQNERELNSELKSYDSTAPSSVGC